MRIPGVVMVAAVAACGPAENGAEGDDTMPTIDAPIVTQIDAPVTPGGGAPHRVRPVAAQ